MMIFALATGMVANVFAQQALNNGFVVNTPPTTVNPTGFSQFEVSGGAITQNFYTGTTTPSGEETGNFATTARWNTMGSLRVAPTAIVNGYRTQTDGRALTTGYITSFTNPGSTTLNPALSDPFVQWIGNSLPPNTISPGNLRFRFAANPTGGVSTPIFTMAPANSGGTIPSFNYAEADALVGQLQTGTLGSFAAFDTWSATGQVTTPNFTTYGSRYQYKGNTVNIGHVQDMTSMKIKSVIDFGSLVPSFSPATQTGIFQFRTFTDPTNSSSIKNIWQSNNINGNIVFGRQDYSAVTSSSFYVSLFDGVASAASMTALNFVQKAGLYVTGDGLDQNNSGNQLNSYAAVVGDVSGVNLVGAATTKYAILGIANGNYTTGNTAARNAGYFIGNLAYTGSLSNVSDQKFKTNINAEDNIMPKLMKLQPKNYLFDIEKYKNMAFSDKLQHGLISQEVENVFPELVEDAFAPNTSNDKKENGKPIPYKGLNYMGLIPMLLKGLQEQQAQITALKTQLETVTSNTLVVTDKNSLPAEIQNKAFALSQNVPNPFSDNTTISYTIPATAGKAILAIFDLNGKMLMQYNLQQGKNTIVVKGNTLSAGMYLYSLIADGQEVLSKRMVLTK